MSRDSHQPTSLFSSLESVHHYPAEHISPRTYHREEEMIGVLNQLVAAQERQTELLEELVHHLSANQRQRSSELGQWKQANPELAENCREAAESLGQVQTQFLINLTEEINENAENFVEGDFLLNEFVDRYGPRMAHLNGVLQVLSQLSSVPNPASTESLHDE